MGGTTLALSRKSSGRAYQYFATSHRYTTHLEGYSLYIQLTILVITNGFINRTGYFLLSLDKYEG